MTDLSGGAKAPPGFYYSKWIPGSRNAREMRPGRRRKPDYSTTASFMA